MIYSLIGKLVVKYAVRFLRRKMVARTVILGSAGAVAGIAAIGVAGYLATRDVPEG
ncbi:MAG: hypothetical protein M3Y23_07390 [Actinomycetota bacterium]|nr:hypothetical protein [Actinomycetota bacterium]